MEWVRHRKHGKEDREEGKDRNIIIIYEIFFDVYLFYVYDCSICMYVCMPKEDIRSQYHNPN